MQRALRRRGMDRVRVTVKKKNLDLNFVVFFATTKATQNIFSSCPLLTHTVTLTFTRFYKTRSVYTLRPLPALRTKYFGRRAASTF